MNYYGINLTKKTEEYNEYEAKRIAEENKAAENVVCPDCGSKLIVKEGFYHCTNPECGYKYEKPEEEYDFWKANVKSDANENGIGKAKGPEDVGLTQTQYNLVIASVLLYGFIINIVECVFLTDFVLGINRTVFLLGYFASCFYGIHLSESSDNPYVSFAGYNFVVLPVGLLLTRYVSYFDPYLVFDTFCLTAMFTLTMMMIGTYFPKAFLDKGTVLMTALIAIIISDLALIFGCGFINPEGVAIFASGVFCLYIAYDWARAQQMEYTLDNAVDVTVAIYLDIINLFMRLLAILDKGKKS